MSVGKFTYHGMPVSANNLRGYRVAIPALPLWLRQRGDEFLLLYSLNNAEETTGLGLDQVTSK